MSCAVEMLKRMDVRELRVQLESVFGADVGCDLALLAIGHRARLVNPDSFTLDELTTSYVFLVVHGFEPDFL